MAISSAGLTTHIAGQTSAAKPLKAFLSRYFYFSMSLIMAVLIVWGFSHTVGMNLFHANPPRPVILWMHGTAFATWVVFYIVQSALVRVRKVSVHRFLGWFGAGLAATMVVLGITVALLMTRFDITVLHQNDVASFLSVPFTDMLIFGPCIAMAIYWRKRPDFHRRLVFIASCQIMDAGIGRFDFFFNHGVFYLGVDALICMGLLRDWIVDGKVHKVYLYALPALIVVQSFAEYTWRVDPVWWKATTQAILGV